MRNLYILLFSVLIISCTRSDDDPNLENISSVNLEGEWNLVNISGGLLGMDQNFEIGTIIWDFDVSDQMVTVTNNNTIEGVFDSFPTGVYPYSISAPADIDELIVNDVNLGIFILGTRSFSVNELFEDGFQIRFER